MRTDGKTPVRRTHHVTGRKAPDQGRTCWIQLVGHHAHFLGCLHFLWAGSVSEVACHEGLEWVGVAGRHTRKNALAILNRLQANTIGSNLHPVKGSRTQS